MNHLKMRNPDREVDKKTSNGHRGCPRRLPGRCGRESSAIQRTVAENGRTIDGTEAKMEPVPFEFTV
ncbi:hypothetical protein KDX32_21435 [Burkholderia ambifaria]|jgi:hypothetical protein|uniref:hypothetical protein n=1 Tax=Burkholderia TaxID=32008 RepID=UPI00110EB612|nr:MULTISPECIES: hypothetical protein [Burkholderia]MBR8065634.1 hypothetical protein [Burkholderia ambifaria]QDW52297.1 hypothetical protein FFI87_018360 [Burkholderia sp. KBS0801]